MGAIVRRNGYGFVFQWLAESGTPRIVIPPHSFVEICTRFCERGAQKWVRLRARRPRAIWLSQKRVRSVGGWGDGFFAASRRRPVGRVHTSGVSGIMRIPRAGPALGWPSRFHHSIHMNKYLDRAAWGRRNLAKSSLAPWWACIRGAKRRTAPAGDDTSQQEETT